VELSALFGGPEEKAAQAFKDAGSLFGTSPGKEKPSAVPAVAAAAEWEIHRPASVKVEPAPAAQTQPTPQPIPQPSTGSGTVVEGFASLFQSKEPDPDHSAGSSLGHSLPWDRGVTPESPIKQGSVSDATLSHQESAEPAPLPSSNWPNPTAETTSPMTGIGGMPSGVPASAPRPLPLPSSGAKPKGKRVFSPLVMTVLILGLLFLGGIFALRKLGGVDGAKNWALGLLREKLGAVQNSGGASGPTVVPQTATIPPATAPGPDHAVPAQPVEPPAPSPAPAPQAAEKKDGGNIKPEPDPFSQASPAGSSPSEDVDPFIPPASPVAAQTVPIETVAAPADRSSNPPIAMATTVSPAGVNPQPAATLPEKTPAPASADVNAVANTPPAAQSAAPTSAETDPGAKIAPILESIGTEVLKSFYQSDSIDGRASFVIAPDESQPQMEAYYRRFQALPTLKSVSFRQPMRDAASGRWFGVFDVQENENDDLHRWCVVQIRPGELKLDWVIYQQLIDQSLDRFLADPAAPPKSFLLVVRPGDQAPAEENPWQGRTVELHLNTPLDTAEARVLLVKESDVTRLELDTALAAGVPRIGKLELMWTQSEVEPGTRVPTVSKVLGWGAW
jgi:hypothetical protein